MKINRKTKIVIAVFLLIFFCSTSSVFAQYKNQEKIPGAEPTDKFVQYMQDIISFGFAVIGILALFMIVIGAYQYLMAAGNIGKVESAKETIGSAVLGLILGLCAWIILLKINPDLVAFREPSGLSGTQTTGGTNGQKTPPNTNATGEIPNSIKERMALYDPIVQKYAAQYGVDPNIARAIIEQESKWRPDVTNTNRDGSIDYGMMQINDRSHPGFINNNNWADPDANISYGIKYYASILNNQAGGDPYKALAMYNGGFRNPNYNYADQVWARYENYKIATA